MRYSGFVNGDTAGVLSGAPVLTTGAVTNSPVGNYVITNNLGSLVASNYVMSLTNGVLTVYAIHNGPGLISQSNVVVNEQVLLLVTNVVVDNDEPPLPLSYSLSVVTVTNQVGNSQVTNAVIDTNGVISWTPSEAQGPGVYTLTTVVTDNGIPSLSATNSFVVTVNEVNTAPVLPSQRNLTINGSTPVVVRNRASDSDIPANPLGYKLTSAPAGASIDANGIIRWTPSVAQVPGVYTFTTVVTDTNVWAVNAQNLTATNSFVVTVIGTGTNNAPVLSITVSNSVLTLAWNSVSNTAYKLQYKDNLLGTNWIDIPPVITANGPITSVTSQISNSTLRLYRVQSN